MKVEYDFKGEMKIVEIGNDESEAKIREREYILYTYLEKSPVENISGIKRIPKSARTTYIADAKKFFKRVLDKGLIVSEKSINPFNIDKQNIDFLKNILDNVWNVESYKKIDSSISSNTPRAFLQHLIDFVENFTMPKIWWLNISEQEKYWKEQYPLDKWQLGTNNDMIVYECRDNVTKGDIAIFYFTGDIKAVRYIGRVYKIDEYIYFDMLSKIEKGFDLQEIRNMNDLENYPPQGGFSKMGNQQIALELVIKCFENGQSQQNMTTNQNLEKQENKPITNTASTKGENMKTIPPLNQILYGPPGTGKTYSTIDRALEILGYAESNDNGKTILNYDKIKQELQGIANNQKGIGLDLENLDSKNDRELAKLLFDYYRSAEQGQIEFVTFHQSFSYEEFVEGIKPKLIDSSNGAESSEMSYTIKSGIFKEICDRALYKEFQFKSEELEIQANTKTRVWKISIVAKSEDKELRDEILKHCLEKGEIRIGWSDNRTQEQISMLGRNDQSSIYKFENEADIGDIVCVFENANGNIKGIGIIESEFYWDDEADNSEALKLYPRVRKVKWLSKEQINIRDLNGGIGLTLKTFYPLYRVEAIELLNRIDKLNEKDLIIDNTQKPFVLIIDEINRGNISKILGELITLIEPSKRIGASDEEKARGIGDESLEVTLPYSNDSFGVPSNLYIIGTMNTADRSIALLDTALRRRFEFIEMMPNCKELQKIWLVGNDEDYENSSIDEWNTKEAKVLYEILTAINNRIEFLLDREHTIGQAFFFEKAKLYKSNKYQLSLDSLKKIFAKKIIPLLQEYFYDDYAKIQAVLNDNGMIKSFSKQDLKVNLNDDFVDSDKKVYRITDSNMWKKENFQRIYDSSIKIDENE